MDPEISQRITRMRETLPVELVLVVVTFALTKEKPIKLEKWASSDNGTEYDLDPDVTMYDTLYPDANTFWNAENPGLAMSSPLFQYRDGEFFDMCFKIFLQNNTFKLWWKRPEDEYIPSALLDHELVRRNIRHLACETCYWRIEDIRKVDLDMVATCAETQSVTLNMGRLCLHTNPTLVLVRDRANEQYDFSSADLFMYGGFERILKDFAKGGKLRKLVLIFHFWIWLPGEGFERRPTWSGESKSWKEVVEAARTIMAWIRKWFEQFDGSEILKVRGSVEGKMVEQDEDVCKDEELRKTEMGVAIGLGYRTIAREFDTIPPLVRWWSK